MKPAHVCAFLRTKKMYIPAQADEVFQDQFESNRSEHCWCNRTLGEVGPDERLAGIEACSPQRPCFEQ
jgi:hypothetical protein